MVMVKVPRARVGYDRVSIMGVGTVLASTIRSRLTKPACRVGGMPTEAVQHASTTSWRRGDGDRKGTRAVRVAIKQRFKEVQPWRSCDQFLAWWFFLP